MPSSKMAEVDALTAEVARLPASDRAELATRILAMCVPESDTDADWLAAAAARLDAYDAGAMAALPAIDVLARARAAVAKVHG